jgi:protein-tyrosine phosphatase
MDIYQVDNEERVFISPSIDDWGPVNARNVHVIIDLDDDLDVGVPEIPNQMLYVYFPIEDMPELPNLEKLHSVARLGARMVENNFKVLVHCGMGHNRSALLAGLVLRYLGMSGEEVVTLIRERRQGALYNKAFAEYLATVEIRLPEGRRVLEFDAGV